MKAIVYTAYGPPDVLQLKDVDKPVPADNEVLIKIHATTVEAADAIFRQGSTPSARLFTGLFTPRFAIPAALRVALACESPHAEDQAARSL